MNIKDKIHSGKIYVCANADLENEQQEYLEKLYDFNMTRPKEQALREKMLKDMLAEIGENCYIEPPFHANWGGKHVHFGNNVYLNFNVTLVDDTHIYIGDNVLIAPNVVIATASHPLDAETRRKVTQFNLPVRIGNNVWIGASAVIVPGVTIGDNTVIGAGSVVTRDIPENCLAVGNPCKVVREINDHDKEFYYKDMRIDI